MTRKEYIEWHIDHYGIKPRESLLDKCFPVNQITTVQRHCNVCGKETSHDMLEDGKSTVTACITCGTMELKEGDK